MTIQPRTPGPVTAADQHPMVPMRDGVRLATDVHLPAGDGPHPVVLMRMPYDKDDLANLVPPMVPTILARGYAFVVQDTRGQGKSEGEPRPFLPEVDDGYDTIDWIVGQEWCDGRVATIGESYYGMTQWAAVASGHPALRAIVTTNTSARPHQWMWRQGLLELGLTTTWSIAAWNGRLQYPFEQEIDWSVRPLADVRRAALPGVDEGNFALLTDPGFAADLWDGTAFAGRLPSEASTIPTLHRAAFWDFFQRSQIEDWALATHSSPAPQYLSISSTDHYGGESTLEPEGFPDADGVPEEVLVDIMRTVVEPQLDFLDQVVLGKEGIDIPRVSWSLTHEGWHEGEHWPPREARGVTLHGTAAVVDGTPAKDGGLALVPAAEAASVGWVHDPNDLVPTQGTATALTDLIVPPDDSLVEDRADVLTFTTEPLAEPWDLAGPIVAEATVGSSATTMHVVARLIDVFPDGSTRRIRDGAALVPTPGGEARVSIELGHTSYRVRAGHRLRVHIASSDFPRYLPYFGDDRDPWTATEGPTNAQHVVVGGPAGLRLTLSALATPQFAAP